MEGDETATSRPTGKCTASLTSIKIPSCNVKMRRQIFAPCCTLRTLPRHKEHDSMYCLFGCSLLIGSAIVQAPAMYCTFYWYLVDVDYDSSSSRVRQAVDPNCTRSLSRIDKVQIERHPNREVNFRIRDNISSTESVLKFRSLWQFLSCVLDEVLAIEGPGDYFGCCITLPMG